MNRRRKEVDAGMEGRTREQDKEGKGKEEVVNQGRTDGVLRWKEGVTDAKTVCL